MTATRRRPAPYRTRHNENLLGSVLPQASGLRFSISPAGVVGVGHVPSTTLVPSMTKKINYNFA